MTSVKGVKGLAIGAGVGAIGAVGLDYLWQYASGYLPASLQTGYVGTLAKASVAVGAGWLASKAIGRQAAVAAVCLGIDAIRLGHSRILVAGGADEVSHRHFLDCDAAGLLARDDEERDPPPRMIAWGLRTMTMFARAMPR